MILILSALTVIMPVLAQESTASTTTATTTTETTTILLTTTLPTVIENEDQPCVYSDRSFQTKKVRPASASTLEVCKLSCEKERKCLAWEFLRGKRCWMHVVSAKKNKGVNYGISHCINHGRPSENAPTCSLMNERVVLRGLFYGGTKTEEKCRNECESRKKCLAWQYNVNSKVCRISVKIDKNRTEEAINSVGYCNKQ